jgi:ABC transporter with metal-binding/Fe-S-binding domain ATP-binding protein
MEEAGSRVELLISMLPINSFSYMLQKVNVEWTKLQAEAMGIRHVFWKTDGEKEKELNDIEAALKENMVTDLVTGAVASSYQKERIDGICKKLGIVHHSPLWGCDALEELKHVSGKFDAIITRVSAAGLDESFLGKRIAPDIIEKLLRIKEKNKINISFEGGEAESFVLDAPLFKNRIRINKSHIVWNGDSGDYIIDDAELVDK